MHTLRIANGLKLPLEAATETFAMIGRRGSGKTTTSVVMVEEMLSAGVQVVVLDPVGVWHGLRSSRDGKSAGFGITVLGGEHGDLPLSEASGALVADFVVEHGISTILDTSLFSKSAQRRFVADFGERLYRRKAEDKYKSPLHLVIEEADSFAPQRLFAGDERMFGAIDTLVRRGRSRGVGVTLITQRAAVVSKDVLSQTEVLVCLQTTAPQDRKAVEAWVEAHDADNKRKEFMESLASLSRGMAWFWSPGMLDIFKKVQVRDRTTFDSSATPKIGQRRIEPKQLAKVDIEKLRASLAETVKAAEENDPAKLKARIRELERAKPAPSPDVEGIKKAAYHKGWSAGASHVLDCLEKAVDELERKVKRYAPHTLEEDLAKQLPCAEHSSAQAKDPATSEIGSGMRRMLIALAQHPSGVDRRKLGILAGLSSRSGSYATYLSRLRSSGLMDGSADCLRITEAGIREAGDFKPLPTGPDLFDWWLGQVGAGERRILEALRENPKGLSRHDLAALSGLSEGSGSFATYLSRLRTLELISRGTHINLSEELR